MRSQGRYCQWGARLPSETLAEVFRASDIHNSLKAFVPSLNRSFSLQSLNMSESSLLTGGYILSTTRDGETEASKTPSPVSSPM